MAGGYAGCGDTGAGGQPDRSQALFPVSQLAMPDHTPAGCSTFSGLAPQARYRLRVVDHPDIQLVGEGGHTMRRLPGWMNQTSDISGEWLAQAGIQLPVLDPESAMLIALERLA